MRPDLGALMRPGFLKPLLAVAFGAALICGQASARGTKPPEPALWQLSAGESKVYLFGSIHMLPTDWPWRTKAIDAALRSADRFVFETSLAPSTTREVELFVREHGRLPNGVFLSRMLSPEGLKSFEQILSKTPLDPAVVDSMRPWLALTVLTDYQVRSGPKRSFAEEGVDYRLQQQLLEAHEQVAYLETPEAQLKVLMAMTPDEDIAGFERSLHELLSAGDTYRRLLESWTAGDQAGLAKLMAEGAAKDPAEKRLLLDGRNRNWLPQIEAMMVSKETIFVTVGAGHLVGPGSLLDMLCVRGWKVQRISTGPSVPPPACPARKPGPTAALQPRQVALRQ